LLVIRIVEEHTGVIWSHEELRVEGIFFIDGEAVKESVVTWRWLSQEGNYDHKNDHLEMHQLHHE